VAILKSIGIGNANKYTDNASYHSLIHYCMNPKKLYKCGGVSVDAVNAACQMSAVAEAYNKNSGKRLRHMILRFIELPLTGNLREDCHKLETTYQIAFEIALFYQNQFQTAFYVHRDEKHAHIHFIINRVDFMNGRKYDDVHNDFRSFVEHVENILAKYYIYGLRLDNN